MRTKPKQCVNSECRNILYVPENQLHMMFQCEQCIERRTKEGTHDRKDPASSILV